MQEVINQPLYPMDMDLGILIPCEDSLQEVIRAHEQYDPPSQPLILGYSTELSLEEMDE